MAIQGISQKWCVAVVSQTNFFEKSAISMSKEKKGNVSDTDQIIIKNSLDAISQLIIEYKKNFRECLKKRLSSADGTGVVIKSFKNDDLFVY